MSNEWKSTILIGIYPAEKVHENVKLAHQNVKLDHENFKSLDDKKIVGQIFGNALTSFCV
jgi:hypothetical protein